MDIDKYIKPIIIGKTSKVIQKGVIDLVWLNGENFKTAKDNDLLFGPFTDKLPNFNKYIDKKSEDINTDFGTSVD